MQIMGLSARVSSMGSGVYYKLEKRKRTLRFGYLGLVVMVLNVMLDIWRQLYVSATLIALLALLIGIIMYRVRKGWSNGVTTVIVVTINLFLTLITFAEGLDTGGYLFILPLFFAITFLLGYDTEVPASASFHFVVTAFCYCFCLIYAGKTSNFQDISVALYREMFLVNSILVVLLCGTFAYMGWYFERKYIAALVAARLNAEEQQRKITLQHNQLKDIAALTSHDVRAPLANIMGLISLFDLKDPGNETNREVLINLQESARQLDFVVHNIVAKADTRKTE